ncbi:hypothetical protein [Cellulophaga omnivescoria]|uniref:hypothetical protein n=1 Tax=Cellulophaga omnivescoria TaxID=1888890 RepID=UPI0022F0611D|nr:hypothetical protein [Cellulophaga omnivescoria]WBU89786.1 hypothetical protein PBN93_01915 [Cellulophaga omnivescoria]
MKKYVFTICFLVLSNCIWAQEHKELKNLLWENVESCFSNFKNLNKKDKNNLEIIEDTKNGYLEVCGTYPTCGCYCSAVVAVFKDANKNYTLLKTNENVCSWTKNVSSDKEMEQILPNNFGFSTFSSSQIIPFLKHPAYYLNFKIPIKGTDIKVTPELIPLGLNVNKNSAWVYGYSQNNATPKSISNLKKIVSSISNSKTIDYLISGNIDSIAKQDLKIINTSITDNDFSSSKELAGIFEELKNIYQAYVNIQHNYIILGWDKEKAAFFIKEKGDKPETITFKNFLLHANYWEPIC